MIRFFSMFDGCHMFGTALRRCGMQCVGVAEIDRHAAAVTAYHYPETPQIGDVRNVTDGVVQPFDLLLAGWPCQGNSVAGSRGGLADERSGLFGEVVRVAREFSPRWLLLENVPGLLSVNGGRDMGAVVGSLVQLGYGLAWRVLDAQHFGVPQRRRRLFIVGCLGDARRAGEVLFEREGVRGDSPARRAPGASVTERTRSGVAAGGRAFVDVAPTMLAGVNASGGNRPYGTDVDTCTSLVGVPAVVDMAQITSASNRSSGRPGVAPTLAATGRLTAFNWRDDDFAPKPISPRLDADGSGSIARVDMDVRRLMPVECERLQGLPDNYTAIGADGPVSDAQRYKMVGNGGALPVVEWIGLRVVREDATIEAAA